MRDLVRRIEQLEKQIPAHASVMLIGWQCEPHCASCGGERIERETGETLGAFSERAAERFRPSEGVAAVWMGR